MKRVATVALIAALAHSSFAGQATKAGAAPARQHFVSKACRFELDLPPNWIAVPGDECTFTLQPKNLKELLKRQHGTDVYSISLQAFSGKWDEAADEAGFHNRQGKWVHLGEFEVPAESFSTPSYRGLRAMSAARCYDENGTYAGQCDQPLALIEHAGWIARITGGPRSEDEMADVVKSFRFLEAPPAP